MGRKKIQISRITDERNRQVTFNKRKFGVMKKAYELSVLCDCEIALIIFSSSNKLYQYASTDMDKVLLKYTEYNEPHESLTNKNIIEALNKKEHKNGVMSPDSPEPEADYQLTPRTEAKYSKIDEEFQMMMQRNQINGQRVGIGATNYTLPVTVPVNSSYNDSALLQSSPQMVHTSISPRPSSSETDSVYPSGSMLEISNGYPNSTSPLGPCGSPSPGPSPDPVGKSGGMLHPPPRQHSPTPRSNLRVVIPTAHSMIGSSINQNDDVSYNDTQHNRNPSSLNTPVVTLQTPSIPGLNYSSSISSFSAQDFSMSTDIGLGSLSWSTHQIQNSLAHSSALPHLAVSSSTPPPSSSSPLPMKIKSEPISPPRDHHTGGSITCGSVPTGSGPSTTGSSSGMHMGGNSLGVAASPHSLNLSHTHHNLPRPNSTGHLTPTSGTITPTNLPSPGSGVGDARHSGSSDYDNGPMLKRSRVGENWAT